MKIETVFAMVLMVITAGFIIAFQGERRSMLRQIDELQVQLAQSVQKADTFTIRDSVPVFVERIVEVDRTDYRKMLADKKLIEDLRLRIKEVESENRTLLSARDTVVLEPAGDSALTYKDNWVYFRYLMNERVLDYSVRDSLSTFVTSEYRHHFLWWRWGRRGYNVTIVSHNPRSRIEYNKYIKVKQ